MFSPSELHVRSPCPYVSLLLNEEEKGGGFLQKQVITILMLGRFANDYM
jgi:hypothetical protein